MLATNFHRCIAGAALFTAMISGATSARASEPMAPLAPAAAPEGPAPAAVGPNDVAPGAEPRPRGVVVSGTIGVNFLPVYPVPSGEFSLFVGGALPIKTFRPNHWLALGYRGTLSAGLADLLVGDLVALRHHLALQGVAGKRGRFFFGASVGIAHFPAVLSDRRGTVALEGEGRLGGLFGSSDVKFLVGVQIRLSGAVGQFQSDTLIPNLGLFFGVNFGPRMRAR